MRIRLGLLVVVLAGVSFAQDTNFAQGPQYLITTASPLLLQPISTPTLSFSSAIPDAYAGPTELAPSQISSDLAARPSDTFLSQIYWGDHTPSEILERRVTTPSMTVEQTQGVPTQPEAVSSVIEITSAQTPANLPASIVDPGVTAVADAQSLGNPGYGVSLGEFATRLKSRKGPSRVFTNEDLEHLRSK